MPKPSIDKEKAINTWKIPCFPCEFLEKCGVGQDHNPIECLHFNMWLIHRGKLEEPQSATTECPE